MFSDPIQHLLNEMQEALADEILEQKKMSRIKHIATQGTCLREENGRYIYSFVLDDPWEPQDDIPLKISRQGFEDISCEVVTARGTLITLATTASLPPPILQEIILIDDSTILLKNQQEALKQAREGKTQLASKSFGLLPARALSANVERQFGNIILHQQQHSAVSKALGGEIAFIIGPPGTGKTLTLAITALKQLQNGNTILIAAHTNIAVDNAIMKLCDLCRETGHSDILAQHQVIRYGTTQKAEIKSERYQDIYLPAIVQRLNAILSQRIALLTKELALLQQQITSLLEQQHRYEVEFQQKQQQYTAASKALIVQITTLEQQRQSRHSKLLTEKTRLNREYNDEQQKQQQQNRDLARAKIAEEENTLALSDAEKQKIAAYDLLRETHTMGRVKRLLKGLDINVLEEKAGKASRKIASLQGYQQNVLNSIKTLQQRMHESDQIVQELQQKMMQLDHVLQTPAPEEQGILQITEQMMQNKELFGSLEIDHAFLEEQIKDLRAQQQQKEAVLESLHQQMRDIEARIIANARVIGTTLTRTFRSNNIHSRRFDHAILDEVSMAPLPLIYLAATQTEASITFIGDPQQLAPIATADTLSVKQWLKRDIFGVRNITLNSAIHGAQHSTLLDMQSRMHPDIARLANQHIYAGQLKNDMLRHKLQQVPPLPTAPLVLCTTQDASPVTTTKHKSRQNHYQALCCLAIAKKIVAFLPQQQNETPTIGIITPYAAQAKLLQKMIKEAGLELQVQAGTIHRFQGLEFDFVIFDTVVSGGLPPSQFLSGASGSDSMRILNVAITRARHKLIIVADQTHILQNYPESAILKQIVRDAGSIATISSLKVIGTTISAALQKVEPTSLQQHTIPAHLLPQVLQEAILIFPDIQEKIEETIEYFTENDFYQAFQQDVKTAQKSLVIASPFLSSRRIGTLLPMLQQARQRNLQITIYSLPFEEKTDYWHKAGYEQLRKEGFQITGYSKMHEKIAAIDEKITYIGSLNILSHSDTHEVMVRIRHLYFTRSIIESLQKPVKPAQGSLEDSRVSQSASITIPLSFLPTKQCICGQTMTTRSNSNDGSVFYSCPNRRQCSDPNKEDLQIKHLKQVTELQNIKCKKCKELLKITIRQKRAFLICTSRCTEKQQQIIFFK